MPKRRPSNPGLAPVHRPGGRVVLRLAAGAADWLGIWASAALLLAPAATGCAAAPSPASDSPAAEPACPATHSALPPGLRLAPAFEPPPAEIALTLRLGRAEIRRALEQQVPETLAAGTRRVSVGRLSFSVRRGAFDLGLDGGALVVAVPIHIAASVCVPLGPLCPSVGGCSPELTTRVRVPLRFDERYALGPAQVTSELARGCTVAGHDATGQIRSQAERQSAELERRVDELLPSIEPELSALWTALHEPMPLGGGACLRAQPLRVEQRPPTLDAAELSFGLAVVAALQEQPSCPARAAASSHAPLPPAGPAPTARAGDRLVVARLWPWAEVSVALGQALESAPALRRAAGDVEAVVAAGVLAAGPPGEPSQPRMAIGLPPGSASATPRCRPRWLLATPYVVPGGEHVRLSEVRPLVAAAQDAGPDEALAELARLVEQQVALRAPGSLAAASAALQRVVAQAAGRRSTQPRVGRYEPRSEPPEARVTASGLAIVRAGRAAIPLAVE